MDGGVDLPNVGEDPPIGGKTGKIVEDLEGEELNQENNEEQNSKEDQANKENGSDYDNDRKDGQTNDDGQDKDGYENAKLENGHEDEEHSCEGEDENSNEGENEDDNYEDQVQTGHKHFCDRNEVVESAMAETCKKPHITGFLPWEDLQMVSRFTDKKEELLASHSDYTHQHPELRALLADFVQALFIQKPENVFKFAHDFFRPYHPKAIHDQPFPSTRDPQLTS